MRLPFAGPRSHGSACLLLVAGIHLGRGADLYVHATAPARAVPLEALVGIVYVVAAAAGILLLSKSAHGKEELQKTLVGDLLTVSWSRIWITAGLYAVIGATHWAFRRIFIALSFQPDSARARGLKVRLWDFVFYALFGLVVTSFVHVGGVLLVFSYLIVPAVCGNYLTASLRAALGIGWLVATVSSGAGLYASYRWDVPTGAAVVCALGVALLLAVILAGWRERKSRIAAAK